MKRGRCPTTHTKARKLESRAQPCARCVDSAPRQANCVISHEQSFDPNQGFDGRRHLAGRHVRKRSSVLLFFSSPRSVSGSRLGVTGSMPSFGRTRGSSVSVFCWFGRLYIPFSLIGRLGCFHPDSPLVWRHCAFALALLALSQSYTRTASGQHARLYVASAKYGLSNG